MVNGYRTAIFFALGLAIFIADQARADAIDGNWCYPDGRHMEIDGSKIVTPGGATIRGEYDRHAYAYVVPKNEAGEGNHVTMVLISEDYLHVWPNDAARKSDSDPQVWRRCELTS